MTSEMDDKFNRRMHAYQNDVEYKGAEGIPNNMEKY